MKVALKNVLNGSLKILRRARKSEAIIGKIISVISSFVLHEIVKFFRRIAFIWSGMLFAINIK